MSGGSSFTDPPIRLMFRSSGNQVLKTVTGFDRVGTLTAFWEPNEPDITPLDSVLQVGKLSASDSLDLQRPLQ